MKKGFTLIEMLIVVVIIRILASALIPRLTGAKDKADNTRAQKDVRDIVTALSIYQMDKGGYPVSISCNGTIKTECTLSGVYKELSNYLKNIPQGNTKLPQWTIGNGHIVPSGSAYGYIGTGQRYILSYQFVDPRDGQRYKAVRMPDDRRWMAENLNYKTANSVCYNDVESNCENDYGRLYDWNSAMTACPQGWKLPTDDELFRMLNKVEEVYGGIQNHTNSDNWNGSSAGKNLQGFFPGCQGTDIFGFSALPAGYWQGGYNGLNSYFVFRTAGQSGVNGLRSYFLCGTLGVNSGMRDKSSKYSVRCVQ